MQLPSDCEVTLCKNCSLFLKRTAIAAKKKKFRICNILPMDQNICFILEPGSVPRPDIRNLRRMFHIAEYAKQNNTENFYFSLPFVKDMVEHMLINYANGQNEMDSIAQAWWQLNGKCDFFSNKDTARFIRNYIKRTHLQAQ